MRSLTLITGITSGNTGCIQISARSGYHVICRKPL
jgi:hypothetical protein